MPPAELSNVTSDPVDTENVCGAKLADCKITVTSLEAVVVVVVVVVGGGGMISSKSSARPKNDAI